MATTELPPTDARPEDDPLPDLAIPQIAPSNGSNGSRDLSETVITDRDLLQTLLAVDGRRTVQEIAAGRGPQAQTHLQSLAAQGLIRIELPTPPAAPAPVPVAEAEAPDGEPVICPKLGFWDNAASHYSRPTQLHRCFASGSPAPLTAGQQEHLCLTGAFSTCPRLGGTEAGAEPRAEARPDGAPSGPAVPSAPVPPVAPISPLAPEASPTSAAPETGPGAGWRLGLSVRTLSPIAALSAAEGVASPEPSGVPAVTAEPRGAGAPPPAEASASGPTQPGQPARLPTSGPTPPGQPARDLPTSGPTPPVPPTDVRPVASGGASGGGQGGRWVALGAGGLAAVLAVVLAVRLFVPGGPPPTPTSTQAVPASPAGQTGQPGQAQSPAPDVGFRSEVAVPESRGQFPLGYVTVAFDKEFPPYAPVVLLYQEKLAEKRGLGVRFVPFDIEDKNRISEQRRAELLQSGGFDVLLTTMNSYALWGGPQTGRVTAIVGESAGADKAIVQGTGIRTFNDLRGKAVAYSDSSVSEYLLYYMLRVGGVPVGEVTRFGQENLNQAARRYLTREAHGVVGWTSGDMAEVAARPGSTVLMDSDQFRVTMDVVVSGSKSLETRREALQAFHEAWFEATRMTIEQPDRAAQAMARWSNRWTGVGSPQDLRDSLEEFAQATVQDNQAVMAEGSLPLLYERYKEAQSVWRSGGREPRYPLRDADLPQAFDPAFVRKAATQPALTSTRPPVNPTFHLTARPEVKGLSAEQQQRLTTVAVLGVDQVRFPSGSATLPDEARRDLEEQVIPVLRSTVGTYLRIEGSAGWAGGKGLDESRVNALAFERARAVQSYVLKYGISADRVVLSTVVPRCRECAEADAGRDDRAGISLMTT